ncbi:Alpha/Beta hydrolase protein [Aspergillus ambiguus]|uniref:uncharacterized protein n=1 Tax=Aspergillus ambiguus TaxID=176160 RepID=UPI003CCE2B1D
MIEGLAKMDVLYRISPEVLLHACASQSPGPHKKPLLVFLHYWGGSSSTWHKLTSRDSPISLSSVYPTLAVDLRGWGQSEGPKCEDGSSYSISAMASDIAMLLEHLKTRPETGEYFAHGFVFVGHSMGAKVALGTLPLLPAQLRHELRGLVLVAPAPPGTLDLPPEMKEQQKVAYASEESIYWTVTNVLAKPENLGEKDIDLVVRDSLVGNQLAKRAWPTYGMREDLSESVKKSFSSIGNTIRARIIVGELDVIEPRERVEAGVCDFLKECGLQVTLDVAPGVKHLVPLECPEIIHEVISSLDD